MKEALKEINVLEIGSNISAPLATRILSEFGAVVIKMESKKGDPSRQYLSPGLFASINAGKKSAIIDSASWYQDVLAWAHVIVDNRSPSAKARDITLMTFLNKPKTEPLIYMSIVGFSSVPKAALDVTVTFETGLAYTNADARHVSGRPEPLKPGFVVLDTVTAIHAASLIQSALIGILRGTVVANVYNTIEIELSMASISAFLQMGQFLSDKDIFRKGNRDAFVAPFSIFTAANNQYISLGITDDKMFLLLSTVLNHTALASEFSTNAERLARVDELEEKLNNIFKLYPVEHWLSLLEKHGIPCGRVNTVSEAREQLETAGEPIFTRTEEGTKMIAVPGTAPTICPSPPKLNADQLLVQSIWSHSREGGKFGKDDEHFDAEERYTSIAKGALLYRFLTPPKDKSNQVHHDTLAPQANTKPNLRSRL